MFESSNLTIFPEMGVKKILFRHGIEWLEDLAALTPGGLLSLKYIGRKRLRYMAERCHESCMFPLPPLNPVTSVTDNDRVLAAKVIMYAKEYLEKAFCFTAKESYFARLRYERENAVYSKIMEAGAFKKGDTLRLRADNWDGKEEDG